jgi:hypothetical protein
VTSVKTVGGQLGCGVGTFIMLNDEGWIITAQHVIKELERLTAAEAKTRALEKQGAPKINPALSRPERRRLANAHGPKPDDIDRWSVWWGVDGVQLEPNSVHGIETVDLAVGKLTPFNKNHFPGFPVFKKTTNEFESGVSLCRLGFPFYDIQPTFDPATGFHLTNMPLPVFANEGVLSRAHEFVMLDATTGKPVPPGPFPLKNIETSSPGIRGQSGGPIFDTEGVVWAMQTATASYDLDLGTREKQYYHVGIGVHAATIVGFLRSINVKCNVSDH